MKMINSGAQNCTFTKRHISSEKTTSERLSQNFGCGGDSHQCDKEEFVSGFGIISAYDDIIEPRQSIPLETNAKKTYTHVSCTHLVRRMKAVNSPSIHRIGTENNTLQERQEEKLVDTTPMEGLTYLRTKLMEKKKRRRR
jgi:hypothetical protein